MSGAGGDHRRDARGPDRGHGGRGRHRHERRDAGRRARRRRPRVRDHPGRRRLQPRLRHPRRGGRHVHRLRRGGSHRIVAGTADGTDTEADVIRSSGYGLVTSGMAAQPNADVIDLAFGEVGWSGIQTAPGAVSVGTDGILGVDSANGDVTMHASGTVTGADTALTWTGQFDRLVFSTSAERGRFTFRGTSGTDHVKVEAPTTYDRDVALRGGKDSYESNTLGGKVDADQGRRWARPAAARAHRPWTGARRPGPFPDHGHPGGRHGLDPRPRLRRPHGGREARRRRRHRPREQDRRHRVPDDDHRARRAGTASSSTPGTAASARGPRRGAARSRPRSTAAPGNDTLTGSLGSDRLIGGPGKDLVQGRTGGFDVCQGEKLRECEKRI